MADVDALFSHFVDEWNAGRRPDADAYLERAADPAARRELAEQINAFVATAPVPPYSDAQLRALLELPEVRAAAAAFGAPAGPGELLAAERARQELTVRTLARRVADALGGGREDKIAWYLEGLEAGTVAPQPVQPRAWEAIGRALGIAAERLRAGIAPPAPAAALMRDESGEPGARHEVAALADELFAPASPGEWDEVDALFRGER